MASILTAWLMQLSGGEPWLMAACIAVLAVITTASVIALIETAPQVAGQRAEETARLHLGMTEASDSRSPLPHSRQRSRYKKS